MAEMKWTKEQQQVIDARGRNLLVSAAAGSGKTAALVLSKPFRAKSVSAASKISFLRISGSFTVLIALSPFSLHYRLTVGL